MPEELEDLFPDADLRDLAETISRAGRLSVDADPAFRSELRRTLMREAYDRRRQPSPGLWRRLFSPPGMAWAGAALGLLLIAGVAVNLVANPPAGNSVVVIGCNCTSAQAMSLVQPIELSFSQPMDPQSVEKAISISPATSVNYAWTSPTSVRITPVAGDLAPNTQYQVKIASAASTAAGQQIGKQQTITFTTQPPPTPTPSPSPSSSPAPAVSPARSLAQLGSSSWSAWAPDGSAVYLIGQGGALESVPAAGGAPKALVPDGVTLAALSLDGAQLAYFRGGKLSTLDLATQKSTDVASPLVAPTALGWRSGPDAVTWADPTGVFLAGAGQPTRLLGLPAGATTAAFAPGGVQLAYETVTHGLAVHDFEGNRDVQVAPAFTGFVWQPNGKALAFADPGGLQVTDLQGSTKPIAAQLTSASGAAWTSRGQLLVPQGGALYSVRSDGTGFRQLVSGDYSALDASPDGTHFAFARDGQLWSAGLSPSVVPPLPTLSPDLAAKLLGDYMTPRIGSGDDLKLSRWFAVYSEPVPGTPPAVRYSLRLVYSKGGVEAAYSDQTLLVSQGPDGKASVQQLSSTAQRKAGTEPEVLSVQVQPGELRIGFDSDLDPSSAGAGVTVTDASQAAVGATTSYDAASRSIVLTLPLKPGATYTVQVTGVRDVAGRTTTSPFTLTFTAPAAG